MLNSSRTFPRLRCRSPSECRGETGGFWPRPEPRCLVPEPPRCRSSDPDPAVKAAKPELHGGISDLNDAAGITMRRATAYLSAAGQPVVPAHKVFGGVHPRQVFPRHPHAPVPLCTVALPDGEQERPLKRRAVASAETARRFSHQLTRTTAW